jgi:hypothetical protein
MGYSTEFDGYLSIEPPLTKEQTAYLNAFSDSRRMQRDAEKASKLNDPLREAVGLSIGEEGEYFVGAQGYKGQKGDESVISYNSPPRSQPGLWCKWEITEDGTKLQWNQAEKFYYYVQWLQYLESNFIKKWNRKFSGVITYQGEDDEDFGMITVGQIGIHALHGVKS